VTTLVIDASVAVKWVVEERRKPRDKYSELAKVVQFKAA
jgi:hypothetical protein